MFDTIAEMLRGSAPDDLAHALGTDRTQTRRAMEIGLPALITGLRDKTLEPGGAQNLGSMLDEPSASLPADLDAYLAAGDPAQGAAMLDVAFGDRGEPALASLSSASGLSTRLLAQVMSVLAPLATGVLSTVDDHTPEGLRSYLGGAVDDLESKGFGRVVELVSPEAPFGGPPLDVDVPDTSIDVEPDPTVMVDADESAIDVDLDVAAPIAGATVVEGAFPDADDIVLADEIDSIEIDEPQVEIPDAMPPVPAASIDADLSADGSVAVMDPPAVDTDVDLDAGGGLSTMGWLWWVIGAVLGVLLLLFAISRCNGSDGGSADPVETTDTDAMAEEDPTPDPVVAQRQATLDAIVIDYPGVSGQVIGDVAVLEGTVADATQLATLDMAVRDAGLGVRNLVTVSDEAAAVEGFSVNDLILAQPQLSTLKGLLEEAGLAEALDGNGPFTLFAPTNDAFAKADLSGVEGDPTALASVLRYHLLSSQESAVAISAVPSLSSNQGETITVSLQGDRIVLNDSATVIASADPARNGVMHIVDTVLVPPSAVQLPEELGAELALEPITFALGSADLTDAGKVELDKVVTFLLATPSNWEIGGHTDSDGDPAFNLTLSQQRADAVKTYLTGQGIPGDSLFAVGYGADQPVAANDSPENKARNRRIEFRPR